MQQQDQEGEDEDDVKRSILQVHLDIKDLIFKSKTIQPGEELDEELCERVIDDLDALHPYNYKIGVSENDETVQ